VDVHVVGAGIAGLLIATRLARRGLHVAVTESGGEHQSGETHPLNEVEHLRSVYAGAEYGRTRCLGGTSTRWGGAMIPFLAADLDDRWPIGHAEFARYIPELETMFGLPSGSYDGPDLTQSRDDAPATHVARLAKWPPFAKRNVATLLSSDLRRSDGPEVWLEATATGFAFAPNGHIASVTATAPGGRKLVVRAKQTVFAAGAIESTRLLLLADRQAGDRIFAPDAVLGRYFHDHLSICVADIIPIDRAALNRVAGFRFDGRGMRNLRFEPSEAPAVRALTPASFAHVAFTSGPNSGFEALRAVLQSLQRRQMPGPAVVLPLLRSTPWLLRAAWWRAVEHRLLYPDKCPVELHMVVEQKPRAENRILLSSGKRDFLGQPLAAIDWGVTDEDARALRQATDLFARFWDRSTLAQLGTLCRRSDAEYTLLTSHGIYHPGGSTRLGWSVSEGVVDAELRTFRVPNLSIAATSIFPTGGGANPTMMLMLASLRLADRLAISMRPS
jgi:choline dehydrogenase-like flavoprotein